jgi:hypothetical protein
LSIAGALGAELDARRPRPIRADLRIEAEGGGAIDGSGVPVGAVVRRVAVAGYAVVVATVTITGASLPAAASLEASESEQR